MSESEFFGVCLTATALLYLIIGLIVGGAIWRVTDGDDDQAWYGGGFWPLLLLVVVVGGTCYGLIRFGNWIGSFCVTEPEPSWKAVSPPAEPDEHYEDELKPIKLSG